MASPRVSIQEDDFDLGAEIAALRAGDGGVGAVAAFIGTVRERNDGAAVQSLELEHYPGMTEASIEAMIDEATRRFAIRAARVVHRVGELACSAQIVLVAVTAAHRGEAFQACEFLRARRNDAGGLNLFAHQGSAVLTSTIWADGLVDNPPGQAIEPGDTVRYLPLRELLG